MNRAHIPKRTCEKRFTNYRKYKDYLRDDFNNKCGYCDDDDKWTGGKNVYHIDHFAPKSLFKELETDYSNLVYSCPYCNRAKSNDWVTDSPSKPFDPKLGIGYIDPCSEQYATNFKRDSNGAIVAVSEIGEYMWEKLNLFLIRHKSIYLLNQLFEIKREIRQELVKNECDIETRKNLLELLYQLDEKFDNYFSYINT